MMSTANTIVDLLYQRNWSVAFAEEGNFITSDDPVTLNWIDHMILPPGFGVRNTEVVVPLAKNLVLLGAYEELPFVVGSFNAARVALVNSHTCRTAKRFAYGPSKEFLHLDENDQIVEDSNFIMGEK
jgi:hypothetical protein